MSKTAEAVWQESQSLAESERLELAARILDSVRADGLDWALDDADFAAELDRRSADQDTGHSWADIRSELERDL
ncbi:addiction module protein [Fimbriiglobus ruber]|uniref:Uncharacterized protein n=1 Tax=Fimbriiglobus ruber TaxID=1908690 RepID=A0A225DQR5_9BACT|nr:addiction module protein [Fimbriiglobus ruber]OWK40948.1 hypothetical protein FRUB_04840 [Fimbriiglobus ruber]